MPANRLAELRRAAGYSQRSLMRRIAQLSHGQITSRSYLADIERGRQVASPFFEQVAAEALGCSVFEFYGRPRLTAVPSYQPGDGQPPLAKLTKQEGR